MFTILTPAYNRAYILSDAYHSLRAQTSYAFEWLIVDDGSTDDTEALVEEWQKEDLPFSLRYIKQPNGGKHRALNTGAQMAAHDFILILDSDDYLAEDAVATVEEWIAQIQDDPTFAGVAGLRGNKSTRLPLGARLDKEYIDANNIERKKYKLIGDKAEVYRTELLRKYPFPEFEGEKFLSECAVWDKLAKEGYKLRWFNKIIYWCEYLQDGLTKGGEELYAKNFQGFTYCTKQHIECYPFAYKYAKIGHYAAIAKRLGKSSKEIKRLLNISAWQLFWGKGIYRVKRLLRRG